jgi:hypothetical protein
VFTDSLPSKGRPILVRFGSRGNVFTESLPSSGYTRHNIILPFLFPTASRTLSIIIPCQDFLLVSLFATFLGCYLDNAMLTVPY